MSSQIQIAPAPTYAEAELTDGATRVDTDWGAIGTIRLGCNLSLRFYGGCDLAALDRLIEVAQQVRSEMAEAVGGSPEQVPA